MKKIFIALMIALISTMNSRADQQTETEIIEEIIEEFWVQVANGKIQDNHFSPEQICAYSSGGLWEYISDSEMIASLSTDSRLMVKSYHLNVKFLGGREEVALVTYYLAGKIANGDNIVVPNYRTRISQVLEKKASKWTFVSSHASPLFGGSGFIVE